ncbi:Rho termination factor N-terminal domain-containing protein [filamentous cyanobacterium LEGE 11480]|uniref:Rho termination factor N-terminal domain-containing protein n=1 Tax=Romeriopsis navalis LEGE 11480 TaxID=2777977 RepID=A0A928VMS5_9CYAN|nr:Rho termination factor N-terminal domain-containing protein [Romeriopsis navalis]MBE9031185.1 Rho termination factor N-terminal domain-containing protein [Romeriopsis navalis LEGE 11480]
MKPLTNVGSLLYLYLEEIDPGDGAELSDFIVQAGAQLLRQDNQRNWVPLIVKEISKKQYQVMGNSLVYAIAEAAGVERVWCIVADEQPITEELCRVLTGEQVPKINLSLASHDEIYAAFQYLLNVPGSPLKGVKLAVAVSRVDEAPRQYWKNFTPITKLKCGITKGKKLDTLKSVFYLEPQPLPEVITDPVLLEEFKVSELKKMAKKRGLSDYTKLKKPDLIKQLSQS